MINLSKIVFEKISGPVPRVDPGERFITVRFKTDGLSKNPPSFISSRFPSRDERLNKGAWARRSSMLFAGNEFSDAGVAANVLAANG